MFVFLTGAVLLEVTAFWPHGAGSAGCEAEPWPRSSPVASRAWGERDRSGFSWQCTYKSRRGCVCPPRHGHLVGARAAAWPSSRLSAALQQAVIAASRGSGAVVPLCLCNVTSVVVTGGLGTLAWCSWSPFYPALVLPCTMPRSHCCPSPMQGGL